MRPSPTISRVRGSASAPRVLGLEEARGLDHLRRDLEHVDALERMAERRPERDAAAQAEDGRLRGRRVEQQRHVREQPLGEHVAGVRRVDLAVDGQRRRAGRVAHRDGGAGAVAVVEQPAGGQREFERVAGHRRGVLVGAARQQFRAPRWQRPRWPRRRWLRPQWPTSWRGPTARCARPGRWPPALRSRRGRAACRTARSGGSG